MGSLRWWEFCFEVDWIFFFDFDGNFAPQIFWWESSPRQQGSNLDDESVKVGASVLNFQDDNADDD